MNELINNGWQEQDNVLFKVFKFKGFLKTMSFANAIAWEANRQNHHPDMHITFNTCTIKLTTHDKGNTVTEKDIMLATSIEKLFE